MLLICLFLCACWARSTNISGEFTYNKAIYKTASSCFERYPIGLPFVGIYFPILIFIARLGRMARCISNLFDHDYYWIVCLLTVWLFASKARPTQDKTHSKYQPVEIVRYVLNDRFFPFYVAVSIPPIMMTAAFYFQVIIFESNQWDIMSISIGILCYALTKFIATIFVGPIIERNGVVLPLFC